MKFKKTALAKIRKTFHKKNHRAIGRLMGALDVGERIVTNYLRDENVLLTTKAALLVIQSETGLTDKELFQSEKTAA